MPLGALHRHRIDPRLDRDRVSVKPIRMKFTAKLDATPVKTYFGELAIILKQSLPDTIRGEGAAIVRKAMSFQAYSKIAEVKERALKKGVASFRIAAGFGGTTNVSKRRGEFGSQWMVGRKGGKPMPMGMWDGTLGAIRDGKRSSGTTGNGVNKIRTKRQTNGWYAPAADWARYKAAWAADAEDTKKRIADRLAARGLAAKSWLEIIDKINAGSDDAAAFIRRARPISNKSRSVAGVVQTGAGTANYQLTIINASGIAIASGGQRKLATAITIRRKFFMDKLRAGFFDDAKFVARNYKWARFG